MTPRWHAVLLCVSVLTGLLLRSAGFARGDSDFVLTRDAAAGVDTAFYHFHPDEETLLRAAQRLGSPLAPPLTAYGMLPLYAGRAALVAAGAWTGAPIDLDSGAGWRRALLAARALALVLSLLTLAALWLFGRRHFDAATAAVAVALAAAPPLALQDAHFYTVGGGFALLCLLALLATAEALRAPSARRYAAAGALIGLSAAVRLNGLATGLLLGLGHLAAPTGLRGVGARLRRLGSPRLWLAGAVAVLVLLALEPYLLTDPASLARARSTDDFAYSMGIARGDILRPWALVDARTAPYLHFWSHLLPQSAGWPLALLLAAAVPWALWRGGATRWLLAGWCALYFLPVGALHTKHVRYLLPMLAPLCLLAADLLVGAGRGQRRRRVAAVGVGVVVIGWTTLYGVAFTRVYRVEDARVTAARWIAARLAPGRAIAVERGAFSMAGLIDPGRHAQLPLNTSTVFATRGYLTCAGAARYLAQRLLAADEVALVDVNRFRQYTAAPHLYPAMASFYGSLVDGRLGFAPAARFKVYPEVAGLRFDDDAFEPSFLGFDHPAVHVLTRRPDAPAAVAAWQAGIGDLPGCADRDLVAAAAALRAGDVATAAQLAERSAGAPGLAALVQAHSHGHRGDAAAQQEALERFAAGFSDPSLSAHLLPWASATSLLLLDDAETALQALGIGWRHRDTVPRGDRGPMARSYIYVAEQLLDADRPAAARDTWLMAADIWPDSGALNDGGSQLQESGAAAAAAPLWRRSLELTPNQPDIHRLLRAAEVH